VTQTVGCNAAKTEAVVLNSVSVSTAYSSNFDKEPFKLVVKSLNRFAADIEVSAAFTDDGRLKSINQVATGQGEAVVKSAVSLAGSIATLPQGIVSNRLSMSAAGGKRPLIATQCDDIEKWGDKKPISLVFRAAIDQSKIGKSFEFKPSPDSEGLYKKLKDVLPALAGSASEVVNSRSGPSYEASDSQDVVLLELQRVGVSALSIVSEGERIGSARILVPLDETYRLPIPKAALFGKQTFSISLSDSGAVASIGYGKNSGLAAVLNAANSIVTSETASVESANLKAQADLIVQQQRWVLCSTKPDQCK